MLRNAIILGIMITAGFFLTTLEERWNRPAEKNAPSVTPITASNTAPDFEFTDWQGRAQKMSDFKGKIVILNFWASWCAPCVKEFPLLLDVVNTHSDSVVLMALSSDTDAAAMTNFLTRQNFKNLKGDNVFIALDAGGKVTQGLFQTYRLPETIIIDRNGFMRDKLIGANWDKTELEKLITKY
jgi:thiol-disulfide isomerase/thioredoxin